VGARSRQVPKPELDESKYPLDAAYVIVKVLYSGVCGSDAGIWFRTSFKDMIYDSLANEGKTTRIVGHEILGRVVEAGSVSRARYGFEEGEIVSAESHIICGMCHQCLIGQTQVCTNEKILGISTDGGFAEYIKLPARVLWRTDTKKIRREIGAIQEPFGNAVHACTAVDLRGKNVAIFGTGAIGQFVILIARALGAARIIGVEPDPRNAKIAMELGADDIVQFTPKKNGWRADPEVVEALQDLVRADGVDVGMEMAGFNSSVNNAIQSARRGGEVVLFGIRSGDFQIENFSRLIVKGLTIRNVIGRRIFETWEITKNLLESKDTGIQKKIWDVMLKKGRGTILDINKFDPDTFEKKITTHPKILIKW
jgi:threonine 3-dehydrogenase